MTPALADGYLDVMLVKAYAGLRPELRVEGTDMRQAFMSGRFSDNARKCWAWALLKVPMEADAAAGGCA